MASTPHIFGIRHHGPGCARSLLRALEELQPDCIVIEGPPEAEELLSFATAEGMEPPVALLVYAPDEPKHAAFYPFAEFSPEWQAILFGVRRGVPIRFMDLPQTHAMALRKEHEVALDFVPEEGEVAEPNEITEEIIREIGLRQDPLGFLARAAGFGGGEEWWEHMVEYRQDGTDLFAAIGEAMAAVREEVPAHHDPFEARRELLREAHMRKVIRAAQKQGFERIAVICGAWHGPALATMPAASADNELLKGLPKMKVETTWVPWTYERLAAESGYGAGVQSPAWYEHLWRSGGRAESAAWFARVARLLREADIDCSSAHIIECVRLSEALAAVRERPIAGLNELLEAARAVLTTGDETPIRFIRRDLIVGRKMGRIAPGVPAVPLQRDIEKKQKSLRLKVSASEESLELDLRKENDRARSQLLHRLNLLEIRWGKIAAEGGGGKGTFRERWKLQWDPEFALGVIEAAPYGNTVEEAATAFAIHRVKEASDLPVLTEAVRQLLLADLPTALAVAMRELENRAALTGDIPQLMSAVPPLAQVSRYGDVRQTDVAQVVHVLDGLIVRVCIGLGAACQSMDDDAASGMASRIENLNGAIKLLENPQHNAAWLSAVTHLADAGGVHDRVRGLAARILLDEKVPIEQTSPRMSRALSRGAAPEAAAAWLEGFLSGSGMVLVHDDILFRTLDEWVSALSPDHFTQVLPLVRRTFSMFPPMERRQIGERVRAGANVEAQDKAPVETWDETRARRVVPVLHTILNSACPNQQEPSSR